MKLPELLQSLNRISANGLSRHAQPEVVIPIYQPGRLGGQFAVPVTHVNLGFDWDQGKLFLESDESLTLLSAEEVEDIRKHASLGQNRESHQRYAMLTNLLARIHRDGGQYVKQHGMDKAFADADAIVAELYAAPVSVSVSDAKAQEPVAEVKHGPLDSSGWPEFVRVKTIGDFDLENLPNGMKFYAAPVSEAKAQGVVMPERKHYHDYLGLYDKGEAIGHNNALDEVARLNAAPAAPAADAGHVFYGMDGNHP